MARGKAISVKIATPKVIKALEAKLAELETNYKKQDENEAKFQKSVEKWNKEIAKFAVEKIAKAENIRTNYRAWTNSLNVDFDLKVDEKDFPKQPERDFENIHVHTYKAMKEEIENAIRILKMTDEEVVNTSTYNAIAQYL
jgi:septal ring factor EnvC (AmiA/AmiB activator)